MTRLILLRIHLNHGAEEFNFTHGPFREDAVGALT